MRDTGKHTEINDLRTEAIIIGYSKKKFFTPIYFVRMQVNGSVIDVLIPSIYKDKIINILKIGKSYNLHIKEYVTNGSKRYKFAGII